MEEVTFEQIRAEGTAQAKALRLGCAWSIQRAAGRSVWLEQAERC